MKKQSDAAAIAKEVIQHLSNLNGAQVQVTMEIHAEIPGGADEPLMRTIAENCQTLKFGTYGFEKD